MSIKDERQNEDVSLQYRGHRLNLRDRLLQQGPSSLQDFEVLELLLSYAVKLGDIRPLVQRLINHLGSFNQVIDSPQEVLEEVMHLEKNCIALIKLIRAAAEHYLKNECLKTPAIPSFEALIDFCRISMGALSNEQVRVIFLNKNREIIAEEILQEGTVTQAVIYPRKVIESALKNKAAALILVHNHPGGNLVPSARDLELTRVLVKTTRVMDLEFLDHLIVNSYGYFSFRENRLL